MYVLDSNILIYHFKAMGRVDERLSKVSFDEIAVPTAVLFEMYVGLAKSQNSTKRSQQLEAFIAQATILPLNREAAFRAAQVRADLERVGQPIGPIDTLIAGITMTASATLVTHNTREFSKVRGLLIEDWYD